MATKVFFHKVAPAIYTAPGVELAPGEEATIFLDQERNPDLPASIIAITQSVSDIVWTPDGTSCPVSGKQYAFQYDTADLNGAVNALAACDVVSVGGRSCCEELRADIQKLDQRTTDIQTDLDTWDVLQLGAEPTDGTLGTVQVESLTVAGTITQSGIAGITFANGLGSPHAAQFNVVAGDTPAVWAAKAAAAAAAAPQITALYEVDQIGATITQKPIAGAAANNPDMEFSVYDVTSQGITEATSTTATAGVAPVAGTAASRIGQHAHWVGRIWEATSVAPATWVELASETNAVLFDRAQALTDTQKKRARDNINAARGDSIYESAIGPSGLFALPSAGLDNRTLIFASETVSGNPDILIPFVLLPTTTPLWATAYGAVTPGDDPTKTYAILPPYGAVQNFSASTDPLVTSDNAHGYINGAYWFQTTQNRAYRLTSGGTPGAAVWEEEARYPTVTQNTPTTGFDISVAATWRDQLYYLTPAGTLANGTFRLPSAVQSRAGQKVTLFSSQTVTALTVNVSGGGTLTGTAITTIAANASMEFQCVQPGTWVRLR